MRTFHIPIQIEKEELIVGGKFSLRQMILAMIGVVVAGGIGFLLPGPIEIRVVLALLACLFFVFLIFAEIHGMSADRFIWNYLKFYFSEKVFW